jgi:hypothetical protein
MNMCVYTDFYGSSSPEAKEATFSLEIDKQKPDT